uniref:Uncharacterized protein n=1 Tax=Anguilla anguilla TaxID=7936 RepID=A0A0E9R5N0_ANGAN
MDQERAFAQGYNGHLPTVNCLVYTRQRQLSYLTHKPATDIS